jgi:hypothetical protein
MERSAFGQECGRMASGVLLSKLVSYFTPVRLASYLLCGMDRPDNLDSQRNLSDDRAANEIFAAFL